jgi:hypothetical protein
MIRARDISEAYEASLQTPRGYCEIFVNPERSELQQISSKYIRFIADDVKKNIYVWDANLAIHTDIIKKVPVSFRDDGVFYGQTKREGAKYVFMQELTPEDIKSVFLYQPQDSGYWKDVLGRDWTWTRNYNIDLDTTLNLYRNLLFIRPR